MEKFLVDDSEFRIDTALLSPFLTFDSKPVPTGLCPLTPSLLPMTGEQKNSFSLGNALGSPMVTSSMVSPAVTPVLGPLTPGQLLRFSSSEPTSDNIKSKFYSLFPNYRKSSIYSPSLTEKSDTTKLSHKEAEQRRRDEFKEKLQNLKSVLAIKKHATKVQIVDLARETILEQRSSIRELEEMVRVLLAERGL